MAVFMVASLTMFAVSGDRTFTAIGDGLLVPAFASLAVMGRALTKQAKGEMDRKKAVVFPEGRPERSYQAVVERIESPGHATLLLPIARELRRSEKTSDEKTMGKQRRAAIVEKYGWGPSPTDYEEICDYNEATALIQATAAHRERAARSPLGRSDL